MRPAQAPSTSPTARPWLAAAGLVFVVAGVICAHDGVVLGEALRHKDTVVRGEDLANVWTAPLVQWIGQPAWRPWFFGAALVALVVGLAMVWAALRPRRSPWWPLDREASIWTQPVDIARACSARAEHQVGVMTARTVATARQITITVTGDTSDESLAGRVEAACTPIAALLTPTPAVRVRVIPHRRQQ